MNQKKVFLMVVILVMGASLLFSGLVKQESAKALFERAVYLQETRGDLEGAIEVFQKIVKDFPKEREIAAKAQLQIGLCLQKLGMSDAQKAFQAVLEKYPDQTEAVKIAREKLSLLLEAQSVIEDKAKELKIQKILSGREAAISGDISPDGKYLSFTDWDTGDLAIRELADGKSRRLTNKGSWLKSQEFALYSKWSPDGNQVLYSWYDPEGDTFDIYTVGLEEQKPRILYKNHDFGYIQPFDWHPDGKRMLIGFYEERGQTFVIGFLSVVDGNFRILKTFKRKFYQGHPWGFVISPDGRTIAFDDCRDQNPNNRDIFLLSSDGTYEEQLISHPSFDYVFDWTSDGKYLLFGSERTGVRGVWIVPVKGGQANGTPSLVKPNIGPAFPIGCTLRNQFYFGYNGSALNDVYVVKIDPLSGLVLESPKVEIRYSEGHNSYPDYSPDGKYLAYSFLRRIQPMNRSIRLYSLENGGIRELDHGSLELNYPQWRPDGKAITWEGTDSNGLEGIYEMDVNSEKISPLVQIEENEEFYSHRWAIDGQTLFYTKGNPRTKKSWIFALDLKTGLNEKLQGSPDDAKDIDISPDGRMLVFLNRGKKRSMRIIPISGGEPQELHNFETSGVTVITPAWSVDGKRIFFYSSSHPLNEEWNLWMYSLEEKRAQELNLKMANFRHLSVHPDGHHLSFSSFGFTTPNDEVWVMENFLPKIKDKK